MKADCNYTFGEDAARLRLGRPNNTTLFLRLHPRQRVGSSNPLYRDNAQFVGPAM
jgi:hypothetical protein